MIIFNHHVVGNAFISHRESDASEFGRSVAFKLTSPEIGMQAFLSKDRIVYTDDIVDKILQAIVDADLLVFLITSGTLKRSWLEWEHEFCRDRKIMILYIVFPDAHTILDNIPYFDKNNFRINLHEYSRDLLVGELATAYFQKETEITSRIEEKKKITISVQFNNSTFKPSEKVEFFGSIKHNDDQNLINSSKAYLHIPNLDPKNTPQSFLMLNDLSLDSSGNFSAGFDLPNSKIPKKQTWYIEIKIDKKSKLFPIEICPIDGGGMSTTGTDSGGTSMEMPPPSPPQDFPSEVKYEEIKQKINSISDGTVKSIPTKIQDDEIQRTSEVSDIISKLESENRIIISGDKGVGKSVLLCQAYQKLKDANQEVLFLRCDDFLGIDSVADLEKILDDEISFSKIVKNWPDETELIVLFDSLDAISRNTKSMGIFKQFLKILWGTNKIKTICSVRSYDYEYSPSISTTDWGFPITLDELTNEDLEKMLVSLGNPKIPLSLKHILYNPLRLKLLSLIVIKNENVDFSKITNEMELYHAHWNEYVEKQEHPVEVTNTLFDIAEKMVSEQKILIPESKLESSSYLAEAGSRNIIKIEESRIQFFHHAYLDYVVSKLILEKYHSIIDYIKKDEYNVFLRPTILFTLSLLHAQNKKRYLENVYEICNSTLKYYWKISTLKSLSEVEDFEVNETKELGILFTKDLALQRHFLSEISKQKNSFWFKIWNDTFLKEWYSKENGNGHYLINYLKAMEHVSEFHEKLLSFAKSMINKKEHPMIKKQAIEATSEISSETKSEWYIELSKNIESQIRSGVIFCLTSFIEIETQVSSEIFSNVYTFEEKSDEKTEMLSYGTMGLTSTKRQDNQHVVWECGEIFPKLFEKNNIFMTKSVIQIFEKKYSEYLEISDEPIVEDYDYIWYEKSDFSQLHDENKLVSIIEDHCQNCSKNQILELEPILRGTRLALFRKILLNMLLRYPDEFYARIFQEISLLPAIKITSLEIPVRKAIKKTCLMLEPQQIAILLENIMTLEFNKKDFDDERYQKTLNKIKATYLSEFDDSLLSETHKTLLSKFSEDSLIPEPPVKFSLTMEEPGPKPKKESPEDIIDQNIDQDIDFNKKIELLDSMVEYLGGKTEELDKEKIEKINKYLIQNQDSNNPEENSVDQDSTFILGHQSVRGLVARGIIRLFYHTKDQSLKELITQMSNDEINIVRGEVCKELPYLFFVDYPLTLEIAIRYSKETDNRVLFYLSEILRYIVNKSEDDTVQIIKNILTNSGTKNFRYIQNLEYFLLHLSIKKQHSGSKELLDEIISSHEEYATEIRRNIPFVLKEHYLYDPETQDFSLEVFLTLLKDDDHEVREASSFFLLHSIEKIKEEELVQLIEKISPHLDIIAQEIEKRLWQPKIIENLIHFLEKFWKYIPEKTLDYLEKISSLKEYSPFQPIFARGTITMLNGIFQLPSLSKENRNRSLSILDIFAMAGWPEALTLLSVMERPD